MSIRYFAIAAGVVYALVGLMGLLGVGVTHPATLAHDLYVEAQYGYLLGLFPVNILHNLVHLLIGVWGLAAYRSIFASRTFARGLAIVYAVLAVMGLFPVLNTTFGLVPIFGHDIWLHAVTAGVAAYFGWAVAPVRTTPVSPASV